MVDDQAFRAADEFGVNHVNLVIGHRGGQKRRIEGTAQFGRQGDAEDVFGAFVGIEEDTRRGAGRRSLDVAVFQRAHQGFQLQGIVIDEFHAADGDRERANFEADVGIF